MADSVALHQLVGAVAGAIVDAQGLVEQHYVEQVRRYFGPDGRPKCMTVRMPRASSTNDTQYVEVNVPLLSLVESSMLAIKDMRVELDVELGAIVDTAMPEPVAANAPVAAAALGPAPVPLGAPLGFPEVRQPAPDPDAPVAAHDAGGPMPQSQSAPQTVPMPTKQLTLGVGSRQDSGPRARLAINVAAHPPTEGMLRLLTQLNKLV